MNRNGTNNARKSGKIGDIIKNGKNGCRKRGKIADIIKNGGKNSEKLVILLKM
jgi:hypothetical protein